MKQKIGKKNRELFYRCRGNCKICFDDGGCALQRLIAKYGLQTIIDLIERSEDED
jgi:hypothetical protein